MLCKNNGATQFSHCTYTYLLVRSLECSIPYTHLFEGKFIGPRVVRLLQIRHDVLGRV